MQTRRLFSAIFTPDRRLLLAHSAARAFALFFGVFGFLNLVAGFRLSGFDANLWWIDLRFLPETPARVFLLAASVCLISFAIRPRQSYWKRIISILFVGSLAAICLWNAICFYALLVQGQIHPVLPLPLSLIIFAAFLLVLRSISRPDLVPATARISLPTTLALFLVCIVCFPVAQMVCFGKTDYRRHADVAVVLGARAYADGRPSDALADRVRTACQLYREGLVKKLIFSGGPGDGAIHETEAMSHMAIKLGVRREDILIDPNGLNTQATVKNTEVLFAQLHVKNVLVVSHFYHLPRIKMAYKRDGWDVFTVPAKEAYFLRQTPYMMAREVAAMWVYYLRPLTPHSA